MDCLPVGHWELRRLKDKVHAACLGGLWALNLPQKSPSTSLVFSISCLGSHALSFSTQKGRDDWEQEQRDEERPFCSCISLSSTPLA